VILKRSRPLPITGVKKRRRRNTNLAPGAEVEAGVVVVVVAEAEIVNPEEHEVRREEKRKPVTN